MYLLLIDEFFRFGFLEKGGYEIEYIRKNFYTEWCNS